MRSQRFMVLTLVALLAFVVSACGGGDPVEPAADAAKVVEPARDEAAKVMEAAFEVGQDVTLQGQLGCGHCNFHTGEVCSAAMQVAEGRVVILDVPEDHELYSDRFSGRQIEVVGTIASIDEAGAHVSVASFSNIES